jgi:STE24 endopeptidase
MNSYLLFVLLAIAARYLLDLVSDILNLRRVRESLPAEFEGWYDPEAYRRSQRYLRDNTRFGLLQDSATTALIAAMIVLGGFDFVDRLARLPGWSPIPTGLLFIGLLVLLSRLIDAPFSVYHTFVLEERYGFNKTTPRTFALDLVKSLFLIALIGGPLLAAVLWFFDRAGGAAWLYAWGLVTLAQLVLMLIAPVFIMPLFNRFTPLQAGELRAAIEDYARRQQFRMQGVFTMDGSRRSSKTNAFFTGLGRFRRIVLFDTLIAKHPVPELIAIVAHEMGHYKRRHIVHAFFRSTLSAGITFFLLSRFIRSPGLFHAFGMERISLYAGLVFFGFLYTPISMALGIIENAVSRRQEFAADMFAARTTARPAAMIDALKRISVDNLSNLTPHPLKVVLAYSHPPMLERIDRLRSAGTLTRHAHQ